MPINAQLRLRGALWGLMSLLLTGCTTFNSDPQASDSTATEPQSEPLQPTTTLPVLQRWVRQIGEGSGGLHLHLSPVLLWDQLIATSRDGAMIALAPKTGEILWQRRLTESLYSGVVGVLNGEQKLLLVAAESSVIALDAVTGQQLWQQPLSSESGAAPVVVGDRVLQRSVDGHLAAFHLTTGKLLWQYQWSVSLLTLRGSVAPVVAQKMVLIGTGDGRLIAVDLQRGEELWILPVAEARGRSELERLVDINTEPLVVGDWIYVSPHQRGISSYNLNSGRQLWHREISGDRGATIDADKRLYLSDAAGLLWSLAASNGDTYWKQDALKSRHLTAPVLQGEYLLVGDDLGRLHWLLRRSGQLVATMQVASFTEWFPRHSSYQGYSAHVRQSRALIAPPLVDGHWVYAMDQRGVLAAYELINAADTQGQ
ncbi:MAG: outer membrane protein assembly factor BamB [Gammaproteobacteria bacterium]|nr:outer membrane protein assembly factor BamB [Gammaproteobacteria bacterium]